MAHIYFHCSCTEQILLNYGDADVADMAEARQQAATVVRALLASPGPEDWRDWMLHISDDLGEQIFALPFTAVMGRLH
jgi:Domain of unknown function (DUF6894)